MRKMMSYFITASLLLIGQLLIAQPSQVNFFREVSQPSSGSTFDVYLNKALDLLEEEHVNEALGQLKSAQGSAISKSQKSSIRVLTKKVKNLNTKDYYYFKAEGKKLLVTKYYFEAEKTFNKAAVILRANNTKKKFTHFANSRFQSELDELLNQVRLGRLNEIQQFKEEGDKKLALRQACAANSDYDSAGKLLKPSDQISTEVKDKIYISERYCDCLNYIETAEKLLHDKKFFNSRQSIFVAKSSLETILSRNVYSFEQQFLQEQSAVLSFIDYDLYNGFYDQGKVLFQDGQLEDALENLSAALDLKPQKNPDLVRLIQVTKKKLYVEYFEKGKGDQAEGKNRDALNAFNKACGYQEPDQDLIKRRETVSDNLYYDYMRKGDDFLMYENFEQAIYAYREVSYLKYTTKDKSLTNTKIENANQRWAEYLIRLGQEEVGKGYFERGIGYFEDSKEKYYFPIVDQYIEETRKKQAWQQIDFGDQELNKQNFEGAISYYQKAKEYYKHMPEPQSKIDAANKKWAWYMIETGDRELNKGNYKNSINQYKEARSKYNLPEINDRIKNANTEWAWAYIRQGDSNMDNKAYSDAKSNYDKASNLDISGELKDKINGKRERAEALLMASQGN